MNVYVEALRTRIDGHRFVRAIVKSPFLLRSAEPPLSATFEKTVHDIRRVGKRIAIGVDDNLWLVLHLMIAGRLHWATAKPKLGSRNNLAAFEFDNGWLWLTEAGTQRRASLTIVRGDEGLQSLSAGGIEPLDVPSMRSPRAARGESYLEARAHRSAHLQRHRQRLLR